jgi:hypothetical protein
VLVQKGQNFLTHNERDEEPDCVALQVVESQLKTVRSIDRIVYVPRAHSLNSSPKCSKT